MYVEELGQPGRAGAWIVGQVHVISVTYANIHYGWGKMILAPLIATLEITCGRSSANRPNDARTYMVDFNKS